MPRLLTDKELAVIVETLLNLEVMPSNTFAADRLTEQLVEDVPNLLETIRQLKECLAWYGEQDNWPWIMVSDQEGDKARALLKAMADRD